MHELIQTIVDLLIVGMAAILIVFTVALIILHIIMTSNDKRVERIKKRILRMLSTAQDLEYLREQIYGLLETDDGVYSLRSIRGIRSNRGTIALSIVVEEVNQEKKDKLRGIIMRDSWYIEHMHKKLHSRSDERVGVFTKLIADLQVPGFEDDVYANLYRWKSKAETQEISLLALFVCGCEEKLLSLFYDPGFPLILSFRQVQELFTFYSGDHQELYRRLLGTDCDNYVIRACIHGIGTEGCEELSPLVAPYLDSDNINLIIESVRTLGKLCYEPALERIRELTSHQVWNVRSTAATALAAISPETCYDDLLRCLCDREWWVRFHAAEALDSLPGHADLMEDAASLGDRFALDMMRYIRERSMILGKGVPA